MLEVIIFGTGVLSETTEGYINNRLVNIKYFCDNNSEKWGKIYKGKEIIDPARINNIQYDFIVIASQYSEQIYSQLINIGVRDEEIFEFNLFFDNLEGSYPRNRIKEFENSKENYECIITGISYSLVGIDTSILKYKSYSFANGSQDLYYDYKIAKYIIENNKKFDFKYCIVGLNYYSFQYDLSLSNMKHKLYGYYDFFEDLHNCRNINVKRNSINREIANKIINLKNGKLIFEGSYTCFEQNNEKEKVGRRIAQTDCNKNYPKTVEENREIFRHYINFLNINNIEPIVVVFPATKYYTKYFSPRIEDEFHDIINEFRKRYNFKYIDYFRSELFQDNDFSDVSHLNSSGAKKFTEIINELI